MLQLKDIKKEYSTSSVKVEALKGINLEFRDSEFVSILGPSGCGKTTLLNIIGGLDKYTSGDLIINNKSTKDYLDRDWDTYRNHSIGFIFQSYNLIMHQTILSNVELALTLAGVSREERRKRATEALQRVGLSEHLNKRPNQLSGGQMQRVAIARALINNPDIILADEPTGALDTDTSVQIMEILKEISKDRLVIMVTHNPELAEQYSTRIIKLLDGQIIDDNNPFKHNEEKKETNNTNQNVPKGKKRNTSMNFLTALFLSINNLRTKKGRTIMTAFAGSIGIIGVALVLAISNGFSNYINTMQTDTLSAYPVTVAMATADYDSFSSIGTTEDNNTGQNNNEYVTIYNSMDRFLKYGHYNRITQDFLNYVKDFEQKDKQKAESKQALSLMQYNYYTPFKFVYYDNNKSTNPYTLTKATNSLSILSGKSSNTFYQELDDQEFMLSQYDVVYTSPSYDANDIYGLTLVIDAGNKLERSVITALGIKPETDAEGKYKNISFEDICAKEYKLIYNDDYYIFDSENNVSTINTQAQLQSLYESATTQTMKINRVLRPKDDQDITVLSSGIMYTKQLGENYRQNCKNSQIAQKQNELKQTQTDNYTFYDPMVFKISELGSLLPSTGYADTNAINQYLQLNFSTSIDIEEAYDLGLQQIGVSNTPISIMFYTKSFDGKKAVQEMIKSYNNTVDESDKIIYGDQSQLITTTLGSIISIISYVLIAFASISLVVSSIMIGVITYTSVIERTKEIGVLRSLGARKKDVSRVFNAETAIIGALAGLIGVIVSYLLCIPISLIISNLANISGIANLSIIHAAGLVIISTLLSLVAGLIPSRYAAKQDPVTALRTE